MARNNFCMVLMPGLLSLGGWGISWSGRTDASVPCCCAAAMYIVMLGQPAKEGTEAEFCHSLLQRNSY